MTETISINLVVEDQLSEFVLRRILDRTGRPYAVCQCFSGHGFGYLKKKVEGFNRASAGIPFLLLTDLDNAECPPTLINEWLPVPRHPNLIFRVAVKEVEAWLLADRKGLAGFLGVSQSHIPNDPEALPDPKAVLIAAARRSRTREIREDLIPQQGTSGKQGPNYNGRLADFVENHWNVLAAVQCHQVFAEHMSDSLHSTQFRSEFNCRSTKSRCA
jgi:hypothetical protein